jgi:hypothetical protein
MGRLNIALEEGFADDTVVIRVNGEEVLNKQKVKTRHQIGLADSQELAVGEDSAHVDIAVPSRNISTALEVPISDTVYVGVSITRDGRISHRISKEPFGYL